MVDVSASRYKAAEPLTDKSASEVAAALNCVESISIHRSFDLAPSAACRWTLGEELVWDSVNQLLAKHNVQVRRGIVGNHREQGMIVERFNRTLAERGCLGPSSMPKRDAACCAAVGLLRGLRSGCSLCLKLCLPLIMSRLG